MFSDQLFLYLAVPLSEIEKLSPMNSILIIGTEPPCPRCGLLKKVVTEKIKELEVAVEVKHLSYTDDEATEFAKTFGLETGTAKDVAKRIDLEIDKAKLSELLQNKHQDVTCEYHTYNDLNWSPDLDEFLSPYETRAKEAGILMTPILVINGEIKHQGSVPKIEEINNWLLKLKETENEFLSLKSEIHLP